VPWIFIATYEAPFSFAGGGVKGFIFDENIPRRLTFNTNLPVYHVADMGESLTDTQIWEQFSGIEKRSSA
jgi:hypothetical protein